MTITRSAKGTAAAAATTSMRAPEQLSRRSFVTLVAAGGAALLAPPGIAAGAARTKHRHGAPPAVRPLPPVSTASASQKEFDRQRTGTLGTLKTLRAHALPPGGDLPVIFKPLRGEKRGR